MRADIKPGGKFPDYELADHEGRRQRLSELQGANAMVLHLSRGGYDPKEHRFLGHLVQAYPDFRVAYTRVVVISTDDQLNTNEFRDALGAEWPFLSDPERVVQRDLDIQEFTDPHHDPMIPHTFILEPGLRIFRIYNGYWFWGRPSMSELHADLRDLFRKIRPDFDPSTPGLREAWDRGERDVFLVDTLHEPIRFTEGTSIGDQTLNHWITGEVCKPCSDLVQRRGLAGANVRWRDEEIAAKRHEICETGRIKKDIT